MIGAIIVTIKLYSMLLMSKYLENNIGVATQNYTIYIVFKVIFKERIIGIKRTAYKRIILEEWHS